MAENKLRMDILAQGDNIREVVAHLYGEERKRLETAAQFLRNERPTILIGVASARYLCSPAEQYLCERSRFARVIPASDAVYSFLPLLKNANVIVNSRSGETAEIVKLAQMLAEARIPFVAVTNEPESTLATLAPYRVWSKSRPDDLVSINVVSGMMTTTLALAAAVTGDLERLQPEFESLEEHLTAVIRRAWERAPEWQALFTGLRPIYLLYRGYARAAALCGRLVIEEVARAPAVALEAAEFRQGPNEVIDARFGAVVFAPAGRQGELNLSLVGDILDSGGRALAVGRLDGLAERPNLARFELPELPDYLFPIPAVAPLQVLAYTLAQAQGIPPGQVRYITKVILSEEGIPKTSELLAEKKPG